MNNNQPTYLSLQELHSGQAGRSCPRAGFTLMEILAVLLVIAVVSSFAVPVFRSVRYDIKNAQAKGALKKLDAAVRSFYSNSRGTHTAPSCFSGVSGVAGCGNVILDSTLCVNRGATGIPNQTAMKETASPEELFGCGYAIKKDFAGLPYKFFVCLPGSAANPAECLLPGTNVYAVAVGIDVKAGEKYTQNYNSKRYHMYVGSNMKLEDNSD